MNLNIVKAQVGVEPWVGSQAVEDAVGRERVCEGVRSALAKPTTKSNSEVNEAGGLISLNDL